MITVTQLLCHFIGDYFLQSSWMANEKTKSHFPALVHVLTYGLAFLFLRPSWAALFVIVSTHFVIDRWRLARYVCWAKNWIAPFWVNHKCTWLLPIHSEGYKYLFPDGVVCRARTYGDSGYCPRHVRDCGSIALPRINPSWEACRATGYSPNTPVWLATWLLIIVDNIMHVVINGLSLRYL
jgi:hypothetical protein